MRITKNQLKQIIKEELAGVLDEETAIGDTESDESKGARTKAAIFGDRLHTSTMNDEGFTSDGVPYNKGQQDRYRDEKEKGMHPKDKRTSKELDDEAYADRYKVKESRRRKTRKK
tara:strand:+ start:69 stop:413 length:345 start_codon:yes stop_codon:yes gene_type:complete